MPRTEDELLRHVAQKIRELRKQQGLRQGEVARRAKPQIPEASYRRIEGATPINLSLRMLARIAGALGTDAAALFVLPNEAPPRKRKLGRPPKRG